MCSITRLLKYTFYENSKYLFRRMSCVLLGANSDLKTTTANAFMFHNYFLSKNAQINAVFFSIMHGDVFLSVVNRLIHCEIYSSQGTHLFF